MTTNDTNEITPKKLADTLYDLWTGQYSMTESKNHQKLIVDEFIKLHEENARLRDALERIYKEEAYVRDVACESQGYYSALDFITIAREALKEHKE